MRGIPSLITDIRKKVFTEVARMAYSGNGYEGAEDLPFKIVPGDQPLHRESIFLERAIAGERVRLAMGLSIRPIQTRSLMTEGMDAAAIAEQYYEPPLINIIPYACHACPTNQYRVTENCQNCLAASCQRVLGGCANLCLEYATKRYRSNVINWGMVPFTVEHIESLNIQPGDRVYVPGIRKALSSMDETVTGTLIQPGGTQEIVLQLKNLSREERDVILSGCLINYYAGK